MVKILLLVLALVVIAKYTGVKIPLLSRIV